MSHLVETLDRAVHGLLQRLDALPAARRLLDGDVDGDGYASFLGQTYLYVRQTRPLLQRAGERLEASRKAPALARIFLQKAEEEDGHVAWVLADLEAIGRPFAPEDEPPPCPAVAAYVAWNHFQVEAGSPLAFLGTAYVLEALSHARAGVTADNLVERRRIPGIARGVRFLRGHADADREHVDVLGRILAVVEPEEEREVIALSAAVTSSLYLGLFEAPPVPALSGAATPRGGGPRGSAHRAC